MTDEQLKDQKHSMSELDVQKLVKAIFPYGQKDKEIRFTKFLKKGIAKWPTWFIVIYRGKILDDYLLLTICGHSSYTDCHFLKDGFDIDQFISDLSKSINNDKVFYFHQNNQQIGNDKVLTPLESARLVKFLEENNVQLFEPTE